MSNPVCRSCSQPIEGEHITCRVCNKPIHLECRVAKADIVICDICHINAKRAKRNKVDIPDIIRRSHIELYKTCPYKFFKEVIENNPQPPNIYTQSGIDIHELFDQHMKGKLTIEQVEAEWNTMWNNTDVYKNEEEELRGKIYQRCNNSIQNFKHYIRDKGKPFATEVQLITSIGANVPQISTTVDRIDMENGVLSITDWKTGKVAAGQKLATDLQVPLYIYAVQQHYKLPVDSFTLYYTSENKSRTYVSIDDDRYVCSVGKKDYTVSINECIRDVKTIFSRIQNGKFSIPHDSGKLFYQCKICHIKEMGLCAGAYEQKWKTN